MKPKHRADAAERQHFLTMQHRATQLQAQLCYAGWLKKSVGWHEQPHSHRFFEALLVTDGRGTVTANGQTCRVQKGDAVLYDPGVLHFESSSLKAPMSVLFFALEKLHIPGSSKQSLLLDSPYFTVSTGPYFETLKAMLQLALKELAQKNAAGSIVAQSLACSVATVLWQLTAPNKATQPPEENSPVSVAAGYIQQHYAEPLNLQKIAENCNLSKYHLAHLFSREMGVSPGAYLLERRLLAARHLLQSTPLSVRSVAEQCGFQEVGYFCRVFKQKNGQSPLQFRKSYTALSQPVQLAQNSDLAKIFKAE